MNEQSITVKTPAAFDKTVCLALQDKAEQIYRLHHNRVQFTNHITALFAEFADKLNAGYSYELNNHSAYTNQIGVVTVTMVKPQTEQEEEIKAVRLKAKADYESSLEAEKQRQIKFLAEQQLATHVRKEEEKRQKELAKLKAQFEADAISCYANVKTSDENE